MTNPWDVPPLPDRGDDDIERTFAGVGHVLSQWESVEIEMSVLFTLFTNRPADAEARREYGKGTIFANRAIIIEEAAAKWLRDQTLESEFDRLLCVARHFADRRNDVAHGIVRPIQWVIPIDRQYYRLEYCLAPPYHTYRKYDSNNRPEYIYISETLSDLAHKIRVLCSEVLQFRVRRLLSMPLSERPRFLLR
jgi:hypothetical protein